MAGQLAFAAFALLATGVQAASACDGPARTDRTTGVSHVGELALASGVTARLRDIRLVSGPARDEALVLLQTFMSAEIVLREGAPDRWERLPARIAHEGRDLAREIVARGLALVDLGPEQALCDPGLLTLEAEARSKQLGLWAEEANRPVQASDRSRLVSLVGRFALVEGRVLSVGERAQRTYVNFGRDFSQDFTVTIPKRTWAALAARNVTAGSLRGRRVRVRGVLEDWNGTSVALTVPDLLELLE